MIRTRTRKILRDLWSRKTRTALVSSSIFIGVFGVVTLVSLSSLLVTQMKHDIHEDELPMISAFVSVDNGVETLDQAAALTTLRSYPNLIIAEGWTRETLFWKKPNEDSFIQGTVRAFSEPFEDLKLDPIRLIEGEYPAAGQQQVVIERRMAESYHLKVGDTITVRILSQLQGNPLQAAEVPEETWTISGIVFHPYIGSTNRTSLYARFEDMTHITGTNHYTILQTRFTDFHTADTGKDAFETFINNSTPYHVDFLNIDNPAQNEAIKATKQWTQSLSALGIIAMLVSSLLVVTVISTIVVEQKPQIGIMKSIGATRPDNFTMYSGIAVVYGLIGTIPGVLLGVPAGYVLTKSISSLANIYIDGFSIAPFAIVVGVLMGLLTPFFASVFPVFMGTRISILEAITDLGIATKYGQGWIATLLKNLPVPISIRQALANIYQKKGRLAMTGCTLTLAAGAFMGVSGLFISLNNLIDGIFDTYNYELGIRPVNSDAHSYEEINNLITGQVEGIKAILPATGTDVDVIAPAASPDEEKTVLYIQGFDLTTDVLQLDLKAGSAWEDDPTRQGIVLTEQIATKLDVGVGDSITVRVNDQDYDLEVLGIDRYPFEVGFMPWQAVTAMRGDTNPTDYVVQFEDENLTSGQVDSKIGTMRELLLQHGIIANFYNQRARAEENSNTITTIGLVFNIASAVMAAVGGIGLLTMLSISVFERQREIGVMRSVGASSSVIAVQFLVEGLLIGLIAWFIGVPLSYGVATTLLSLLPISDLKFNYPLIAPLLGFLGMMVVATTASLYPSLSAARRTVSEILRYQ